MPSEFLKVYVETTIVSYLTARPSRDLIMAAHQQITNEWWETRRANFDLYARNLSFKNPAREMLQWRKNGLTRLTESLLLAVSKETLNLARLLVEKGPLPEKAESENYVVRQALNRR